MENFIPFFLEEKGGFQGTIEGGALVFFAFLGFDFVTCLAEESKNPKKDIPTAIKLTLSSCSLIYCVIAFSLSGMAQIHKYANPETAMAQAFIEVGSPWMPTVIYISAFFGISACAFNNLMSQPRVLYAYAKDGLFFKVFQDIDPKTKVPVKGTWITGIVVCLVCFFLNLETLTKIISLGNLFNYTFVIAAVIALRLRPRSDINDSLLEPQQTVQTGSNEKFAWLYTLAAFTFVFTLQTEGFSPYIVVILGLFTCAMIAYLHTVP
jgi:amino acid transporter